MKRKIVFITTIHRNAERMLPAILEMSKTHDIIIICTGQSSENTVYKANRFTQLLDKNKDKISKVLNSPPITSMGGLFASKFRKACIDMYKKDIPHKLTDAVIIDDSRDKVGLTELYRLCRKHNVPVFANCHGNEDKKRWGIVLIAGHEKFFDKLFVFGPKEKKNLTELSKKDFFLLGGIPDNDAISNITLTGECILVIVNFVQQAHKRDGWHLYDKETLEKMKLKELQAEINLPVTFKLKHRFGHSVKKDITNLEKHVPKGLVYNILVESENDVELIKPAACVLSYGSTMCFKPIQAGIPTIIFEKLGDIGNFDDYYGKVKLGDDYFDMIRNPEKYESQRVKFLENALTGGVKFDSIKCYSKNVYGVINEWKQKSTDQ